MTTTIDLEKMTNEELLVKSYFYKGSCHAALEQHEEAVECYDRALSSGKKEPYILVAKVMSLLKIHRDHEALENTNTSILLLEKELKKFASGKNDDWEELSSEEINRVIDEAYSHGTSAEILKEIESEEEKNKRASEEFFKIIEEGNKKSYQEELLKIFEK